jgi:ubiquinone/menaquinone biosynthesis C-methylase UbiE
MCVHFRANSLTDSDLSADVRAGQSVYSQRVLRTYDLLVLGLSNRFIWKCPTRQLLALYDDNISSNHLDVGVGTGYFLDHCTFPKKTPRIALLDLNENCLQQTAKRIERYRPEIVQANLLEPISYEGQRFTSISMNYVLHCLPGDLNAKAVAFDHLRHLLKPGGVIFGSTLLAHGVRRSLIARRLMAIYNRKRIFSNADDSLDDLQRILSDRFVDVEVTVTGCAALFSARHAG